MSNRLPRQVQKQADNAERLIAEFVKGQEAGQGKPADAQASAPPAQDEPNANHGTRPGDAPASTTDAPGAPGQQRPAAEPRNDYKAQFFTLQGMYAARGNELAAAKSRIAELENLVFRSTGKDAQPTPSPAPNAAPAPTPAPERKVVPEQVRETLGDEVADALQAMFDSNNAELRTEIKATQAKAEKAEQTATETRANDAKEKFVAALTERVPDWTVIDGREDWNTQFLPEMNRIARKTYGALLNEAAREFDVEAAVEIFEVFKARAGIAAPSAAPTPAPAAPSPAPSSDRRAALERQVVPTNAGGSAERTPDKRMWTPTEIAKAYADAAMGRIPADKFAPIEADILAANAEGRITGK